MNRVLIIVLMLVCCVGAAGVFAMPEPAAKPLTEEIEVACHGNGLFGIRGRVRSRMQARQAARAARWAAYR